MKYRRTNFIVNISPSRIFVFVSKILIIFDANLHTSTVYNYNCSLLYWHRISKTTRIQFQTRNDFLIVEIFPCCVHYRLAKNTNVCYQLLSTVAQRAQPYTLRKRFVWQRQNDKIINKSLLLCFSGVQGMFMLLIYLYNVNAALKVTPIIFIVSYST